MMATWAHKYNNNYNATDAPFELLDVGGNVLSSVAINQKNAPSQHDVGGFFWDTLDTVYVAGGQLTVTLGASAEANNASWWPMRLGSNSWCKRPRHSWCN